MYSSSDRREHSSIDREQGQGTPFGELVSPRSVYYGCRSHPVHMRGNMVNLAEVLKELQQERSRLDEAIRVIGQLVFGNHAGARGTKRTLSAAARERIAAA